MKSTIIKNTNKIFFCRNCKHTLFKIKGASNRINKKGCMVLICVCDNCNSINTIPFYAVGELRVE